jgi:hypothetical protein
MWHGSCVARAHAGARRSDARCKITRGIHDAGMQQAARRHAPPASRGTPELLLWRLGACRVAPCPHAVSVGADRRGRFAQVRFIRAHTVYPAACTHSMPAVSVSRGRAARHPPHLVVRVWARMLLIRTALGWRRSCLSTASCPAMSH